MKLTRFLVLLGFLVTFAVQAYAFDPQTDVAIAFQKGAVVLTVPAGAHLKQSFIEVTLASKPGSIKVGPLPKADAKDELNEDIYHGTIRIPVMGEGLSGEVSLGVQYQ